jgi:fructokinase
MTADEFPGAQCWCGKRGCMETWVSGPAFAADHERVTGQALTPRDIEWFARDGDTHSLESMDRLCDRLARGLASIINVLDPHIIVLGGGLSNMVDLYPRVNALLRAYVFSDHVATEVVKNRHGDSSGVRGAAWLWREEELA